jgi:hypothetical protein
MTLREQLLEEIEVAPDSLLEKLLNLCRERNESGDRSSAVLPSGTSSSPLEAVKRLQAKGLAEKYDTKS